MSIPDQIIIDDPHYKPAHKLQDKVAVITGGDSGIGAATALQYAKEGAQVAIVYLEEEEDAQSVVQMCTAYGAQALSIKADVRDPKQCAEVVTEVIGSFGQLDILVLNAGTQESRESITDISDEQLLNTFKTNIFSMFYLIRSALPHLQRDSRIIMTTSVTAYRGSEHLLDYAATKGAIVSLVRSLSQNLAADGIRVNAVAPGPVWSPLVLTSFDKEKLDSFGDSQPLGYAAQPVEIAPAFVFLASSDAQYMSGQVLHVNGGEIIGG